MAPRQRRKELDLGPKTWPEASLLMNTNFENYFAAQQWQGVANLRAVQAVQCLSFCK